MKEEGKESQREFWGGHSFDDDCEWTQRSPFRFNPIDSAFQLVSDFRRDSRVMNELIALSDQLKEGQARCIRRFVNGKVFDQNEFSVDTFVRLSEDFQSSYTFLRGGGEIETHVLFGLIVEQIVKGNRHNALICFESRQVREGRLEAPNREFHTPIRVGEVRHYRQMGVKDRFQFLERVNFVDILKYGNRLRKEQPPLTIGDQLIYDS